jgi:nucleoside-diphosphate-sugar epimerase
MTKSVDVEKAFSSGTASQRALWANLKVLITGGSGFIGGHLLRRLCDEGSEVHSTSRKQQAMVGKGPIWWQADMADLATVRRVLAAVRPDIIFHLAGSVGASPDVALVLPTYQSHLSSTVNVLLGATEVGARRIILADSYHVPGEPEPSPSSPYAAAKWAASGYGRMFHRLYQAPVLILRPFTTYGPAQAATKLIPSVTLSLLKGEAPKVSSGRRMADWVYIGDVIEGLLTAAMTPEVGASTIDLGSGSLVSIREIVTKLVEIVGSQVEPLFGALPDRPAEYELPAETSAAATVLGWRATTSLESGLRRTVEWYRKSAEVRSAQLTAIATQ